MIPKQTPILVSGYVWPVWRITKWWNVGCLDRGKYSAYKRIHWTVWDIFTWFPLYCCLEQNSFLEPQRGLNQRLTWKIPTFLDTGFDFNLTLYENYSGFCTLFNVSTPRCKKKTCKNLEDFPKYVLLAWTTLKEGSIFLLSEVSRRSVPYWLQNSSPSTHNLDVASTRRETRLINSAPL